MALDIFTIICLAGGCFFAVTGAIGILRMPDFFARLHPAGKNDTMGVSLITLGLLVETMKYHYGYLVAAKLVLIVLFIMITAPVATHAITKAGFLAGLKPWEGDDA
ncbi:MAG: monovalent cation/H(+) antiporter subunit G [Planctomycetes bacterium]|nr:monovalent cation/H(+) antiporter subunit G [Planctomycetota bacterium]